jgi:subtilisin family serine protease
MSDYIRTTVAYVASAGNYSLDFPLAPAIWSQVVSVSSSDASQEGKLSFFSNDGEIMAPSSWLILDDHLSRNGAGYKAKEVVLAGTSFSDLLVSLFLGLDSSQKNPHCGLVAGPGSASALAYSPEGENNFSNLTLAQAVDSFCK